MGSILLDSTTVTFSAEIVGGGLFDRLEFILTFYLLAKGIDIGEPTFVRIRDGLVPKGVRAEGNGIRLELLIVDKQQSRVTEGHFDYALELYQS